MNAKILSSILIALGIMFLAYGGIDYMFNLPEKTVVTNDPTIVGRVNEVLDIAHVVANSGVRYENRVNAERMMMFGSVLFVIGGAIFYATRQQPPSRIASV